MFENLKNPIFVLQNAPSLWNRYFDTGKVEIELVDEEKKHYQFSLDEVADESSFSGRAICEFGTTTWIKTALEIVGARNIKTTHTKCRYDGHPNCITDIYWE